MDIVEEGMKEQEIQEEREPEIEEEREPEIEEEEEINLGDAIRAMEVGCASWIVQMEETIDSSGSMAVTHGKKAPSIYIVPDYIKSVNFGAYRPRLVSLGPYHYGEADFMAMEKHKEEAVLKRLERFKKRLVDYVAAIHEVTDELLDEYGNLNKKWRVEDRDKFVQMMVMDGCFLLEVMQRHFDYQPGNSVFSYHGSLTLYSTIQSDIVVLENQLPLLVLQRLLAVEQETHPSAAAVNALVLVFLGFSLYGRDLDSMGLHPIDLLRKGLCGPKLSYIGRGWDGTMPSAAEISDAGINFVPSKTEFIHDINFKNGVLHLPVFKAHDATERHLLNLLAFEKLYPHTGHEVLSYIYFMDNLINTQRDVELLRSKGIIRNLLSSDEELAQRVNGLGTGAIMSPFSLLDDVQRMVSEHCKKPWNRWRASFMYTYLRNPWVFFSLLAAFILLVASILQTIYTILPFYLHKS